MSVNAELRTTVGNQLAYGIACSVVAYGATEVVKGFWNSAYATFPVVGTTALAVGVASAYYFSGKGVSAEPVKENGAEKAGKVVKKTLKAESDKLGVPPAVVSPLTVTPKKTVESSEVVERSPAETGSVVETKPVFVLEEEQIKEIDICVDSLKELSKGSGMFGSGLITAVGQGPEITKKIEALIKARDAVKKKPAEKNAVYMELIKTISEIENLMMNDKYPEGSSVAPETLLPHRCGAGSSLSKKYEEIVARNGGKSVVESSKSLEERRLAAAKEVIKDF